MKAVVCLLSWLLQQFSPHPAPPSFRPSRWEGAPGRAAFSNSGPTPSGEATALMTSWTGQATLQTLQTTGIAIPAPGPQAASPAPHPHPCPAAGEAVWAAWGQPPTSRSAHLSSAWPIWSSPARETLATLLPGMGGGGGGEGVSTGVTGLTSQGESAPARGTVQDLEFSLKPDFGLHSVLKSSPAGPLPPSSVFSWAEGWDPIFSPPLNLPSLRAEIYVLGTPTPRALSTVSPGGQEAKWERVTQNRRAARSRRLARCLATLPRYTDWESLPPPTLAYPPQGYKSLCHREAAPHCHQRPLSTLHPLRPCPPPGSEVALHTCPGLFQLTAAAAVDPRCQALPRGPSLPLCPQPRNSLRDGPAT